MPAWPFGDRVLELPDPVAHDPVRYRANAYWCLMAREDIYGFLSLLCEFRRAHTTNDVETAFEVARYLARATVGAGLNVALLEKAMLLATTVNELLLTLPYCCVPVEIDLDVYARMISKRTAYKEDVTPDPLVHIRLVRTTASRSSLVIPKFDVRLS
nr:hypothetical protein [uncultured Pseudoxanthomonas sp.]